MFTTTLLITISLLINLCFSSPIIKNNKDIHMFTDESSFDSCKTDSTYIDTWDDPTADTTVQFHHHEEGAATSTLTTTSRFINNENVYFYTLIETAAARTATKDDTIETYINTAIFDTSTTIQTMKLRPSELRHSDGTKHTKTILCLDKVNWGNCTLISHQIALSKVNTQYVDKCSVSDAYPGGDLDNFNRANQITYSTSKLAGTAVNYITANKIQNQRLTRIYNNKYFTTIFSSDGKKYCHLNNVNNYYMVIIGDVPTTAFATTGSTTPISLKPESTQIFSIYNQTNGENKFEKKYPAQSGKSLHKSNDFKTDNWIDYNHFSIETDGNNEYHLFNDNFHIGSVVAGQTLVIPKELAESISDMEWCFNGIEKNGIFIVKINILILISILLCFL